MLSTESDGAYVSYTLDGETVKKKLGSGEITIPKIYLSSYAQVYTGTGKDTHMGVNNSVSSEFKLFCEPHSTLKIGSTTASVIITCEKADGTTTDVTVSGAKTIDISDYKYITVKPDVNNSFSANYWQNHAQTSSITLTDVVLS